MAVESRFVVMRNGVEVQTFMDKKAADDYDKMLDMADNLAEMFNKAPAELTESLVEELSIYLAQNREDVLIALQAKKPKPVKKPAAKPAAKKAGVVTDIAANKESA
ncbi:YebG family protein [Thalassotalea agariperforans]